MSALKTASSRLQRLIIGKARDPHDPAIFHKISLMAFFAWISLGSDGISSSCYGPEEAFRSLVHHPHLAVIVGVLTAATIFIVAASYNQIVELFPSGGGGYLVVFYSINVFVTFVLSQLGMVRHWWGARGRVPGWRRRMLINGIGLTLTFFILCSVVVLKFHEGGWVTLIVTGSLALGVVFIKRHYLAAARMLHRLNSLVAQASATPDPLPEFAGPRVGEPIVCDPRDRTAVLLVSGYNGVGLHTLRSVNKLFQNAFRNFIFVQVGMVDAGNFKGVAELDRLREHIRGEVDRYVDFAKRHGYHADGYTAVGNDVVKEVLDLAPRIVRQYPNAVFFGGQLVFPEETVVTRWLHNYITFALQRGFYGQGTPFVIIPIRMS